MDPQQRAIAEEFDRYRESYDDAVNQAIAFSGQKVGSFTRVKAPDLLCAIASHFDSANRPDLLDVGCSIGNYHPFLTHAVGTVSGVDVSKACITKAQERNSSVSYSLYDGDRLPYPDSTLHSASVYFTMFPRTTGSNSCTRCAASRVLEG